jgi:hypothetical protein
MELQAALKPEKRSPDPPEQYRWLNPRYPIFSWIAASHRFPVGQDNRSNIARAGAGNTMSESHGGSCEPCKKKKCKVRGVLLRILYS